MASTGYREVVPSPLLSGHVECFWRFDAAGVDRSDGLHRVLPDGSIDVLVDLRTGSARLIGTMTRPILVPQAGSQLFGIRFAPGGARPLLPLPARRTTDASVPPGELWSATDAFVDTCGGCSTNTSASVRNVSPASRGPKRP